MPIVNTSPAGFFTSRIGITDSGLPVYLYFDPHSGQFRPVVVPPSGNSYYATPDMIIRHDGGQVSPLTSAVVLGTLGAILGGGPGAILGAAAGAALSRFTTGNGQAVRGGGDWH